MDEPHHLPESVDAAAALHTRRAAMFRAQAEARAAHALRLSTARLVAFLAAGAALVGAYDTAPPLRWALLGLGLALLVTFAGLVRAHARTRRDQRWLEERARVSADALARLRRDWAALPPEPPADPAHPYAADLDILGRASVAQLLGGTATTPGRSTLHAWLLGPAPAAEVRARQEAAAELAPMLELRETLAARGRLIGRVDPERIRTFIAWAEDRPWLAPRPALRVASFVIPAATLVLATLSALGVLHAPWWGASMLAAALVSWRSTPAAHRAFERASAGEERVARYADVFALLAAANFESARLRDIHGRLTGGGTPAHEALRRLERILDVAAVRFSSLFYLPAQLVLLWDLHALAALERWQATWGPSVAGWIDALGHADAIAALAALRHDHPDWAFPEIVADGPGVYRAEALGHPLLRPESAVRNDVAVGPPGTFLLVTGSNMSGKSTLLRAIGVNAVLAQAGAPVCARRLTLPPLEVWTSMRVTDSLERGVSHFMAELERLKAIVDAARRAETRGAPRLLYLIDEVLQGTNSAERQVAARRIIRHLVDMGAIGAVTTHDLELGEATELRDALVAVHFRETVNPAGAGPALTFDYRLRPGVATSRNALKLMEIVGLGEER
ncbi:MAG: DNA mismatch repair protein MutS [Gemmatimonadetes bacterium]|nr:DNA mismatch repair protein MutS [Gemmatimonadota bacterium]